ncbi:Short chain dehydrogenase, partial [Pseudomonas coronafaciens pv. garcae]
HAGRRFSDAADRKERPLKVACLGSEKSMSVLDRLIPYAGLRVLISGGAAGIGEVLAAAYMEAGAKVHVCDVSESALAAFVERYPDSVATRADVADPAQVEAVFRVQRERFGGLDVLINNA